MAVSRIPVLAVAAVLALSCEAPSAEGEGEGGQPCDQLRCRDESAEAEVGRPPDPPSLIRFADEVGAVDRRAKLRTYVWGAAELPGAKPQLTEDVLWPAGMTSVDQSAVARLDHLDAEVTGTNMRARSYVLRPTKPAEDGTRVVIIHQGHTGPFEEGGLGRAATFLLERGFTVVAMHMPLFGWNSNPNGWRTHRQMFESATGDDDLGRIFRMFLEPIVQTVTHFEDARDIAMIGLSGGGWAATVAAAIDPRIRVSMEVAGSAPLYARETRGDLGDREQYEATLFGEDIAKDGSGGGVTTWLEMYALAGEGAGRQAFQVNNEFDPCCFRAGIADSYATVVSDRVREIGAGEWRNVIDTGATTHEISVNVLESVLLPALSPPVKTTDS